MAKEPEFNCPICKSPLKTQLGNYFHPNDVSYGMSLYCGNPDCLIEVCGYTRNNKPSEAFEIIRQKYTAHLV